MENQAQAYFPELKRKQQQEMYGYKNPRNSSIRG